MVDWLQRVTLSVDFGVCLLLHSEVGQGNTLSIDLLLSDFAISAVEEEGPCGQGGLHSDEAADMLLQPFAEGGGYAFPLIFRPDVKEVQMPFL